MGNIEIAWERTDALQKKKQQQQQQKKKVFQNI